MSIEIFILGTIVFGGSALFAIRYNKSKTVKDSPTTTTTTTATTTAASNSPAISANNSSVSTTISTNYNTQNIQPLPQPLDINLGAELRQASLDVLNEIYIKLKAEYNSNPECCVFYFEDNRPGPFFDLIKSIIPDKDDRITVMTHMCYHKKWFEKLQDGSWRLTNDGFERALAIHIELNRKKYPRLDYVDI